MTCFDAWNWFIMCIPIWLKWKNIKWLTDSECGLLSQNTQKGHLYGVYLVSWLLYMQYRSEIDDSHGGYAVSPPPPPHPTHKRHWILHFDMPSYTASPIVRKKRRKTKKIIGARWYKMMAWGNTIDRIDSEAEICGKLWKPTPFFQGPRWWCLLTCDMPGVYLIMLP